MNMQNDQVEKIHELLESFNTAMLITHRPDQPLHARPMAIAQVQPDCGVWFFTGRDTTKVHEIEDSQEVLIACQNERDRYISLSGSAELVGSREKIHELWKDSYRTWFPRGIDDPDLLLIHVYPEAAEYWDNRGMKGLRYVFEAAKAYVSGTRPQVKEGDQHGKVSLR
jgi:general stress protein 26